MHDSLHWRHGGVRLLAALLLCAFLAAFAAVMTPTQARAETGSTCTPAPDTGCVQGTMTLSTKEPAVGVDLTLSGDADGAGDEQRTTTDDAGRWAFSVTEAGEYDVTVDEATLPDGEFLRADATRTVQVQLHSNAGALFPLTDEDPGTATGGDDAADASETPAAGDETPAPPEAGADTPTEPEAEVTATERADGFNWARFWQQFVSGIRLGLLIALASLGLSLIFGTTGLSNFSQGELVSMGGITAWFGMQMTGNIWLSGLLAVVVMAAFGWVQDAVIWKPLRKRKLSLMQMMIVSIGLSIALQYTFQFFVGAGVLRIDPSTPQTVTILGITLTIQSYVAMGIAILAIAGVGLALTFTRFGRATRAVADNPALAEASGIDVHRVIRVVWVVGVALAGLAGVLLGLVLNGISWFTGGQMLLLLFAAVILGGIGTAFGAFVGAMIIGVIVEMANIWLPGDLKYAAALLLLIIILLVRPQGIFGRRERVG